MKNDSIKKIEKSFFEEIFITDTLIINENIMKNKVFSLLSVKDVLSDYVKRNFK